MLDILNQILTTSRVTDEAGKSYILHSHTTPPQLKFLNEIIITKQLKRGLEIGLAYGISALQILDSLNTVTSSFVYVVIDPYQTDWNNVGKLNIQRSGLAQNVLLYELPSDQVLPQLVNEGKTFDFVYLDSTKVFDVLMVDVHYLTELLSIGGVIVLDDCDYPGIRLLVRFLKKHPSYRLYGGFNKEVKSRWGMMASLVSHWSLKLIPFRERYIKRLDISSDEVLGVNYKCLAFEKIANDNRQWNWHCRF